MRDLGLTLAARSERPQLPWTFRVVDDPSVNAFALPGGFIYVTRGIMAYLNSEAELVSVLGHEIGHVTARHSAAQMTTQQLAQVGLVATTVLLPQLEDVTGIASAGLGLLFLKFSRDDEREADDLGLRYMTRVGYDPREMPGVYDMLNRVGQAAGGGRMPGWLSTHPDPADREQRIARRIDSLPRPLGTRVGGPKYLRRLDGAVFGVNPREGFFRDHLFYHPDLAFRVEFPIGWQTANQKQAVVAQSPTKDAIVQVTLAGEATAMAAARAFLVQEGVAGGPARPIVVNGLPAASARFTVATEQELLTGLAVFVEYERNVYRLVGFAPGPRWSGYGEAVERSLTSFAELTDRTALGVRPLTLDIVELDRPMTMSQFASRYPSQVSVDGLALLNRVRASAMLPAGSLVKRVVGGPLP